MRFSGRSILVNDLAATSLVQPGGLVVLPCDIVAGANGTICSSSDIENAIYKATGT